MSFLTTDQLRDIGFASVGDNVLLSAKASIYGAERIIIGSNVRIDDFSVISAGAGGIEIGSHVHIATFCSLIGAAKITLEDFSGLSSRVAVYSSNDDYSGRALTGPTVPDDLRAVDNRPVRIGRHAIVGSGSVVLPGVTLGEGVAIGSLSLVRRDCPAFEIHSGMPARKIGTRKRTILDLEKRL
jgi:acetyltransferase-like isoleucine patch superfamily enzyme